MQYRGIAFDIKVSIERGEWVWVVHTPKPRQGKLNGPRENAVRHAMTAMDAWCQSNPHACENEIVA
jgi:hypothetical protein